MNIWLISKYASPPQYTKAPTRLFYLAKEFVKSGNKAFFLTSDSNHFSTFPSTENIYNDEVREGVKIRWVKTKKYQKTASLNRVLSWFDFERKLFAMNIRDLEKPDVIVVSSLSILSIVYGYFLKRRFNARLVFEIRDIWPLTMTEEGGFSKWHPLVWFIGRVEKFGYKHADLIVGTMPRLDVHVKNILGYDRPFFCSPLGFEPENYSEELLSDNNPFRKFVSGDKTIIGYAGSMGITNALEPFIRTIKALRSNQDIHFLLVGSGDTRQEFEKELEGCDNVTFLPRIAQNDVKHFLAVCDVLYLSTKNSEVWKYGQSMNKVVEYMLAAKPIIASYTGYPSMINEANCGVFVDSSDEEPLKKAILDLVNMPPASRSKLGANGRKWIFQNRQYTTLASAYLDAINAIK